MRKPRPSADRPADIRETARRLVEVQKRLSARAEELIEAAAPALAVAQTEDETRIIIDRLTRDLLADLDREAAAFEVPGLADASVPKVH